MTKIMVADDSLFVQSRVAKLLAKHGYKTVAAGDGVEAVRTFREARPDAVLMDITMPRKDGLQALAELRASPHTSGIPIVMLSASLRDEQRALDAGARFFIHKPYDGKKLVAAVQAAIEQA